MKIYKKLMEVQKELKAPKGQTNAFGKYKYRSCEDILEALKPCLYQQGLAIFISDEIIEVNGRNYIKATVTLADSETGETIQNTALAREEESKKGMDGSQVTGASSSYARKYALNGMFAIDDTKDSDATNDGTTAPKVDKGVLIKEVTSLIGEDVDRMEKMLGHYKINSLKNATEQQLQEMVKILKK